MLASAEKWLEIKTAFDAAASRIFFYYFTHKGKFPPLRNRMNLRQIFQMLGGRKFLPVLRYFAYEEVVLSNFSREKKTLVLRIDTSHASSQRPAGYMRLDVSPTKRELLLSKVLVEVLETAKRKANPRFEKFKRIEADEVLRGFQLALMNYLFELKDKEATKIQAPVKLVNLAKLISFDDDIFSELRFYTKDDFYLEKFDPRKREFTLLAVSSGKFPAPRTRKLRLNSPDNWFPYLKLDTVSNNKHHPHGKKNNGSKTKHHKKDELPSLKGKKVQLNFHYETKFTNKSDYTNKKFARLQPALPSNYKSELESLLKKTGAKLVSANPDVILNVNLKFEVKIVEMYEELMVARIYGTLEGKILFGEKEKTFFFPFRVSDNRFKKTFEKGWTAGKAEFKHLLDYYFKK